MPDALEIISRAIAEHHTIREHLRLAGETVNDVEALITVQKAHAVLTQSSLETLAEKQTRMEQALNFLEQGLKNHFSFEEKYLPPLFGDLLMKALIDEHREVLERISKGKTVLNDTNLEGLEQRELLLKKSTMQETATSIRQAVEEHAYHEEIVLNMMKKTLEKDKSEA